MRLLRPQRQRRLDLAQDRSSKPVHNSSRPEVAEQQQQQPLRRTLASVRLVSKRQRRWQRAQRDPEEAYMRPYLPLPLPALLARATTELPNVQEDRL